MTESGQRRSEFWEFWVSGESLPDRCLRIAMWLSVLLAGFQVCRLLFTLFMEHVLYAFDTGEKTIGMIEATNAARTQFLLAILITSVFVVARALRSEYSKLLVLIPVGLACFWLVPGEGATRDVEIKTWVCDSGATRESLATRREELCSPAPAGAVTWAFGDHGESTEFKGTDDPAIAIAQISSRVNVLDIISTSESRNFAAGVIYGETVRSYVRTNNGLVIGRDHDTKGDSWFRMRVDLRGEEIRFDMYMIDTAFEPVAGARIVLNLNVCAGSADDGAHPENCASWSWDTWPFAVEYRVRGPRNEHGFAEELGQVSSPILNLEGAVGTYSSLEVRPYEFYFSPQDANEPDGKLLAYWVIPVGSETLPENSILDNNGDTIDSFTIDVNANSGTQEYDVYLFVED